ncbi:MAG: leucyl aminopeptidase family protein [Proteobacteria bacterium]|nr:leucyl aminopeptidase family protein [Pseudomonadota bacterium]
MANLVEGSRAAAPVWPVRASALAAWRETLAPPMRRWLEQQRFAAKPGSFTVVPGNRGDIAGVAWGIGDPVRLWDAAPLAAGLPGGVYRLDKSAAAAVGFDAEQATAVALGWALGGYRFTRYLTPGNDEPGVATLVWPGAADRALVRRAAAAVVRVRDLVNTPAGDLGPEALAAAVLDAAAAAGADAEAIVGDELLDRGYPLIHAVGRAGPQPPRLVDLRWGDPGAPKVTLVGKGVCFDTGGLDLKTASGMLLMKKDMGGAANALGLAGMVMDAGLDVRLRLLLPIVENSVSRNAFHPGDILKSRNGITVEVGNTDAEGRLILADALTEGGSESPDLLFDFATLTGSARVALGPDLPALFCADDAFAAELAAAADSESDPLWRMPLWDGYGEMLDSKIAETNNVSASPFAGAITAALFLKKFTGAAKVWAHADLFAWNPKARPGRPEGGEAQVMRAAYRVLADRYGGRTTG